MIRLLKNLGMGWVVLLLTIGLCQEGWANERYTVKSGDTLYEISRSYGVSIEALKMANALKGDLLKPKQILTIPTPQDGKLNDVVRKTSSQATQKFAAKSIKKVSEETDAYVVQKGDSLFSISKKVGLSIEEIKKMNGLNSSTLKIGQTLILSMDESQRDEEVEELGDGEGIGEALPKGGEKGEPAASSSLGRWTHPEERNLLVRVVKTFLGVPYKLGGSTLKGIDCSAFVKKIYEIFKVELPRTTREQFSVGRKVERDQLEEGDLVFFKRRGNSTHVGIYIGDNQFVHASYRNREVKIDHLDIPYFNSRFIKGVRVMELEGES